MRPSIRRGEARRRAVRERGASLVIVTLGLVAALSLLALAIDLAAGFATHNEVQRAADAAALAGASAFLDPRIPHDAVRTEARRRALDFAVRNAILHVPIDSSEVAIDVLLNDSKVRVTIRRTGLPTWFARLLGVDSMAVSARAAAQVTGSSVTNCVAPWLMVDWWDDRDDDLDGDRVPDTLSENWEFDNGDRYARVGDPLPTGLGSDFRDATRDYGRPIVIRPADPTTMATAHAGTYYVWHHKQSTPFRANYVDRIVNCDPTDIEVGQDYYVYDEPFDPGFVALTRQAVDSLFRADSLAYWDPQTGRVVSDFGIRSPRILRIPMLDPTTVRRGMATAKLNNVGLLFLENPSNPRASPVGPNGEIYGRFWYYVPGQSGGSLPPAPLIRYAQLTE